MARGLWRYDRGYVCWSAGFRKEDCCDEENRWELRCFSIGPGEG